MQLKNNPASTAQSKLENMIKIITTYYSLINMDTSA